ncbi:MSMEG_0570 family nitrogen starvation response protein [Jiella sonneratiae]|uniref:MSMEG_0570 family nitrogen starvation response protein n=1 Tax=Jiella sonneratiae TaxID=2816856 RepID=A0ABS3J8I4_9HYPH|nr:MSMEG_0570 family nitrogen starvation response protein [Jiella sonneratiae]MBO0905979.1 MSMEG_0570 family nitrogen starvation response protein [Jiella sonneratiae]
MPEVRFTIRWPDGKEERCYSPSTAIRRFVAAGETYPLADFLERARDGLTAASDRVAAKYGFACTAAMAELARIEARGRPFLGCEGAEVVCLSLDE